MNPNLTYKEILELVDSIDPVVYAKTRNHLRGAVTKLSPYITRGVISLPVIRDRVLQNYSYVQAEKFIQELAWREYFQKVYLAKGKKLFEDLRYSRSDWKHHNLVSAIIKADTGISAIDSQIEELNRTGYMHNHARMWTAMLASNVCKAHWFEMSKWMYYHLLDGDLASNTISWQWVAGTAAHKRYAADQKLINGCSDTNQTGTYLDISREDVLTLETPSNLVAAESLAYKTIYPDSDTIFSLKDSKVFIYHPWSIDPLWRREEKGKRIFVIEPRLFDKFPVSTLVMNHMLTILRVHIPEVQVYVGNIETLLDIEKAEVFSKRHPATAHYPGTKDRGEELYPEVQGYFTSFFNFWKACNC